MIYDFHTASCAETPCVIVFTTNAEGEEDEVVAEFYPLRPEPTMDEAEERAIAFLNLIEPEVQR